jgi:hypothetical protein
LSFETWGRGCVFVTPRSESNRATGFEAIDEPRSACSVSEDSDPDDVNPFDDDSVDDVKSAYKVERQALKDEYKADVSDLKDRLDDF